MTLFMFIVLLYALASLAVAILVLSSLKDSSRHTAEPELIRFCGWCKRVEVHGVWSKLPLSNLVPPGQEAERVNGVMCQDCAAHWAAPKTFPYDPAA